MVKESKKPKTAADTAFEELTHPAEGGALAVPEEVAPSVRHVKADLVLHSNDRPISWVKLGQATSASGSPGRFLFTSSGEEVDELLLIPAKIQAVRTLWPEGGFNRGRRPECASEDGVFAVSSFSDGVLPLFPGQPCSRCPCFAPRPRSGDGTNQRICQAGYVVHGFSVSTLEMVGLRLSGTATRVARVMSRPSVFQQKPVRLFSERQASDQGSWHQLMIEEAKPLTPEQMRIVQELLAEEGIKAA
jgi:hypothetical protein